jgi:hypothetical protein
MSKNSDGLDFYFWFILFIIWICIIFDDDKNKTLAPEPTSQPASTSASQPVIVEEPL